MLSSPEVSAVFEDVGSLNLGLFIGNAVDRGSPGFGAHQGKAGTFLVILFPSFPSLSALNLYYFLITKYSHVAYEQAMDATTQHGSLRLVCFFKSIMKTKTG